MKDHFIPCFLLSQFSTDGSTGRKAKVYQLRGDGPHPNRPVAAQDLAHAGDFYKHSDFPGMDAAGLHAKELQAAALIRDLLEGEDPQVRADEIASFVELQAARTRAFRTHSTNRVQALQDKALGAFASPAGLDHLSRQVDESLADGNVEALVRLGIPPPMAMAAVKKFGEDGLRKLIRDHADAANVTSVTELFRAASTSHDAAGRGLAKAQVAAMHKMVQTEQAGRLVTARWKRLETTGEPLILGDCCVVCVGSDGSIGWPFKFGESWREMYLPVGPNLAVVGLAADAPQVPSLDPAALNRSSADLAREYVYASRCTSVEIALAARIGSVDPLIDDGALDDLVADSMQAKVVEPKANRARPQVKKIGRNDQCPCGSGKKFKKCCWPS